MKKLFENWRRYMNEDELEDERREIQGLIDPEDMMADPEDMMADPEDMMVDPEDMMVDPEFEDELKKVPVEPEYRDLETAASIPITVVDPGEEEEEVDEAFHPGRGGNPDWKRDDENLDEQ